LLRNATIVAGVLVLATVLVSASPRWPLRRASMDVYVGDVPAAAFTSSWRSASTARDRPVGAAGGKGAVHVETILSGEQAQQLAGEGVDADAEGDRRPDRRPARDRQSPRA
jgi:hypothetical protein